MTKDIEREAFEALPLAKLALSQDWVRYHKESNTYYPNEDFCPESAPETINFAWQSWQAAKANEAEKSKGWVVVPVEPTPKMIDSTWDDQDEIETMSHNSRNEFIYKKMIRVAMVEAARGGNE